MKSGKTPICCLGKAWISRECAMISIKRLVEQGRGNGGPEREVLEASLQMGRLLLDGIAAHAVRGGGADLSALKRTLGGLQRRINQPPSALDLLEISSDAVEALETYSQRTTDYLREQNEQLQSMVAMLTEALADVSGQSEASVARLQAIELQIERARELDDMRAVRASLENCLLAMREAAAQQRTGSSATVRRLQGQIDAAQKRIFQNRAPVQPYHPEADLTPELFEELPETAPNSYVAVFKLQRAEHIASRFGDGAKQQMLSVIGRSLKSVLGPTDRLLRWKTTSYVMFLNSTAAIQEVRGQLAAAVAATGQQYVEVGRKAALLSIGVDWTVFPQAQCTSLDGVFTEVDSFLASSIPGASSQSEHRDENVGINAGGGAARSRPLQRPSDSLSGGGA